METQLTPQPANLQKLHTQLKERPWEFSLHQILFILELLQKNKPGFGSGKKPTDEPAILDAYCNFSAPSSDCINYQERNNHMHLTVNQTSLVGINGILPQYYSEKIISKLKEKNRSLIDFLNIFNQRFFGLRHKVEKNTKYNLHIDPFSSFIFSSSIGGLRKHDKTWHPVFQSFASFLWSRNKSPRALQTILESIFQIKVRINQFVGRWLPVAEEYQAKLDGSPLESKILGSEAYCLNKAIEVVFCAKNNEEHESILPDTKHFALAKALCKYYVLPGFQVQVSTELAAEARPRCSLQPNSKLGYNTWL